MLVKKTSKSQITLPKVIVDSFPDVDYFEVSTDAAGVILRPWQRSRAHEVRAERDVAAADAWARKRS
jgi:hypothetical protein